MLEKLYERKRALTTKTSDTFAVVREVNALLKSINRFYVISKWVGATSSSATRLFSYFLVGFSLQSVYQSVINTQSIVDSTTTIYAAISCFMIYVVITNGLRIYSGYQEALFNNNLDDALEEKVINHLSTLDLARLSDPEFLELKDSAENRGTNAVRKIFDIELGAIGNLVSLIFTFGIITLIQPYLLFLLVLPVIPRVVRAIKIDRKSRELWESQHLKRRKKRQFASILNDGPTLVMMRLLNFGEFVRRNYNLLMVELRDEQNALSRYERNSSFIMMIPGNISGIIMLSVLVSQTLSGAISISSLFLIFGALEQFPSALFNLLNTGVKLRSSSLDYEYLQKMLNTGPVIDESEASDVVLDHAPVLMARCIDFRYPRQDSLALKNCSIVIKPSDKVAIVGANGSGKTTLARLLAKVYLPESGDILADGKSLRQVTQNSWLSHTLYLGQQFRILELPVDIAITGGQLENADQSRFNLAVEVAGVNEFILPLKDNYKTQIGEQWPGGRGFSGGQMQRLALASAVYRLMEPDVYMGIFDEPMSDCDIETREKFYRSICSQTADKSIVVIAHDPFFLHFFNRVIVMEQGAIKKDLRGQDVRVYQQEVIGPGDR